MRPFRSEWVKLRRPALLYGTVGAMSAAVALATFGLFRVASLQASGGGAFRGGGPGRGPGAGRDLASLVAGHDGWLLGLSGATNLLGLVALVVFASNIGGEYKNGTLRFLLASEPRRLHLLGGKALALASLVAGSVGFSVLVALGCAFAFGSLFDIETSAWVSAASVGVAAKAFFNVSLACFGWGVLGGFLAVAMRTSAGAIGVGVGYLLIGETLLSRAVVAPVFNAEAAWFPGEVLAALAAGGSGASSYVRAALLALLYVGALAAGAAALFQRRDVVS
jgi:hypothetical protein